MTENPTGKVIVAEENRVNAQTGKYAGKRRRQVIADPQEIPAEEWEKGISRASKASPMYPTTNPPVENVPMGGAQDD